jgi:hypothetical protein
VPSDNFGGSFLIGIVYLAIIGVLVKANSQGPQAIQNVTTGLANLVNAGTGASAFTYASSTG